MTVAIFRGYSVDRAGTIEYTDDGDSVAVRNQPIISTVTSQTTRNDFSLNPELYPKRLKIRFTNSDGTNACTLFVSGDR